MRFPFRRWWLWVALGLLLTGLVAGGWWCFPRWQPIPEEKFHQISLGMTQDEVMAVLGREPDAKGEWFSNISLMGIGRIYCIWSEGSHRVYYRDGQDREVYELLNVINEVPVYGDMVLDGNVLGVSFDDDGRVSGTRFSKSVRMTWWQRLRARLQSLLP
jgi:hypothetical protein